MMKNTILEPEAKILRRHNIQPKSFITERMGIRNPIAESSKFAILGKNLDGEKIEPYSTRLEPKQS